MLTCFGLIISQPVINNSDQGSLILEDLTSMADGQLLLYRIQINYK